MTGTGAVTPVTGAVTGATVVVTGATAPPTAPVAAPTSPVTGVVGVPGLALVSAQRPFPPPATAEPTVVLQAQRCPSGAPRRSVRQHPARSARLALAAQRCKLPPKRECPRVAVPLGVPGGSGPAPRHWPRAQRHTGLLPLVRRSLAGSGSKPEPPAPAKHFGVEFPPHRAFNHARRAVERHPPVGRPAALQVNRQPWLPAGRAAAPRPRGDLVGAGWRQLGPLDDWLRDHVGPSRSAR